MMFFKRAILVSILAAAAWDTGCSKNNTATDAPQESKPPISHSVTKGNIEATVTVSPGDASLTGDNLFSLEIKAPAEYDVTLPSLDDRLSGLSAPNGTFDDPVASSDGIRVWRRHARLVPDVAEEYRIAPLVVHYADNSTSPPRTGWFTTPPITLELRPLGVTAAGRVSADIPYHWVRPPNRTIVAYVAFTIFGAGLIVGLIVLLRRSHQKAVLARLTPRQRALAELQKLIEARLIEKHRIKDFYVELTMVVRRYIERQHHVRAPEQTTEEFLQSVAQDNRFSEAVVERLRAFLTAADLVKFAAYSPGGADIDNAVATARNYVETDADDSESPEGGA
jgi:hypothetical protein